MIFVPVGQGRRTSRSPIGLAEDGLLNDEQDGFGTSKCDQEFDVFHTDASNRYSRTVYSRYSFDLHPFAFSIIGTSTGCRIPQGYLG